MTDPKYLFFVGNKRCGTTLMVNLLNLHPDIFVSHESDIIWILYQLSHRLLPLAAHGHEGWLGMKITLDVCEDIILSWGVITPAMVARHETWAITSAVAFRQVTEYLMRHGSEIQRRYDKPDLLWMGDKKPIQCSDPMVTPFLKEHFPDAHYIHMVRHPRAGVASCTAAAERAIQAEDVRGLPDYWKTSPANILKIWAEHEEWALQMEKDCRVARLRLEDLCYSPVMVMRDLFWFLELEMSAAIEEQVVQMVHYPAGPNVKYAGVEYDLEMTPEVMKLMEEYGYD